MNAGIADLLKARIATIGYVDKLAGLVQPVTFQRAGELTNYEIAGRSLTAQAQSKVVTVPIALNVTDPLNCTDEAIRDLVPDERYRMIVYFEDRSGARMVEKQGRWGWESTLRLVAWVNTAKMANVPSAGDLALQAIVKAIESGGTTNSGQYIGVRHTVVGMPPKGAALFSAYTYPEGVRQYLFPPFDSFALDITTRFTLNPDCGPAVDASTVDCP